MLIVSLFCRYSIILLFLPYQIPWLVISYRKLCEKLISTAIFDVILCFLITSFETWMV